MGSLKMNFVEGVEIKAAGILFYYQEYGKSYGLIASQKRKKNEALNFIGGKIIKNESAINCAIREFQEEVINSDKYVNFYGLRLIHLDKKTGYVLFGKKVPKNIIRNLMKCEVCEISELFTIPLTFDDQQKNKWHKWCYKIGKKITSIL